MEVFIRNVPEVSNENHLRKALKPHLDKLSITNFHTHKPQGKKFAKLTFLNLDDGQRFLSQYGQAQQQSSRHTNGQRQRHADGHANSQPQHPLDRGPNGQPQQQHNQYQNGQLQQHPSNRYIQQDIQYPIGQFQRRVDRYSTQVRNAAESIMVFNQTIFCSRSREEPSKYLLRVLEKEAKDRQSKPVPPGVDQESSTFPIALASSSVSCGIWNYRFGQLVYEPQVTWQIPGSVKFGEQSMILKLANHLRIDFRYFSVLNITTEEGSRPSFIFSMHEAPRFYEEIPEDAISTMMAQLGLSSQHSQRRKGGPQRHRLPFLNGDHQPIAGKCLVYRITISTGSREPPTYVVEERIKSLRKAHGLPRMYHRHTDVILPQEKFFDGYRSLLHSLSSLLIDPSLPFVVLFQLQKLAEQNYLPPRAVLKLLPTVQEMYKRSKTSICVKSIRKLFSQIDYVGPEVEASDFQHETLVELLMENEQKCKREHITEEASKTSGNIAIIHRVKVMPSGIHLFGPEAEANNRVLRKYHDHHEYFLRVQFCDDDGQPVRFNPRISNEKIFHGCFKHVLENGINIAGRKYDFLGFSHSSLRAQSCWFMAPFVFDGTLIFDRKVIRDLGDFSVIQSPAKCAARIGQVFSDTRTAVPINSEYVCEIPDVVVNGRTFSDGVGTMSKSVMHRIWTSLPKARLVKPTLFQIRYQGCKGMISLDPRLEGNALCLRPSMKKFDGSTWPDIEICEAAHKPLPMYLNRQFIKILEDMGVEASFFMNLQAQEVDRLRLITDSPINASTFLKRQSIGNGIYLPWLITRLTNLDLGGADFRQDAFLRDVLEMALLVELRLLKHKTRIPVEKGWHLHGLMDETGFLEEGEVYCSVTVEGIQSAIIKNGLIVSRAPALAPGDVQLVNSVLPPPESPLRALSNCVCFSSKGRRDMPSQLSGGDLDGDRYYVMWDENCVPKWVFPPADYARQDPVDIGRTVERSDMTDFFIRFMESDQLGRIAVTHRVLADQHPEGTLHEDCITLSEMHSTAVDFSKTGIPVDMSKMPKFSRFRPDFEAPGPHVKIEGSGGVDFEPEKISDPEELGDEDDDFTKYRYYESHKVLGKLYRAIDERKIFAEVKSRAKSLTHGAAPRSTVMDSVWAIVQRDCQLVQWNHYLEWARDIQEMYEDCLLDIMSNYSEHPLRPLTELEAFIGNILGKTGSQTRHQRELSTTMKEKFEEDSTFIVNCIVKDDGEWSGESLERSMACLAASLEDRDNKKGRENLLSFKYIAAAVCLKEVDKFFGV